MLKPDCLEGIRSSHIIHSPVRAVFTISLSNPTLSHVPQTFKKMDAEWLYAVNQSTALMKFHSCARCSCSPAKTAPGNKKAERNDDITL